MPKAHQCVPVAQGEGGVAPAILSHPLEDLQPAVGRQASHGGSPASPLLGETVIWSGTDLPYLATHNEVSM